MFLWSERNRINAREIPRPAEQICHMVGKLVKGFEQLFTRAGDVSVLKETKWTSPPTDVLKMNSDGAFP